MCKNYLVILIFLLVGCDSSEKEVYSISPGGAERGVHVEVLLKDGGSVIFICPRFSGKPIGAHGRECYLDK